MDFTTAVRSIAMSLLADGFGCRRPCNGEAGEIRGIVDAWEGTGFNWEETVLYRGNLTGRLKDPFAIAGGRPGVGDLSRDHLGQVKCAGKTGGELN